MTPEQQKAKELVEMFTPILKPDGNEKRVKERAKQCALICVDEIIKLIGVMKQGNLIISYWLEVKQEIQKL